MPNSLTPDSPKKAEMMIPSTKGPIVEVNSERSRTIRARSRTIRAKNRAIRIRNRTIRAKRSPKNRRKNLITKAAIKTLRTAKKKAIRTERKIPTIPERAITEAVTAEEAAKSLLLTSRRMRQKKQTLYRMRQKRQKL